MSLSVSDNRIKYKLNNGRQIRFITALCLIFTAATIAGLNEFWNAGSGNNIDTVAGISVFNPPAPSDANDLLVLGFDNTLNGESGEMPTTATGASFQAGIINQGVLLPNPNQLFYSSTNNINASEGTLEFWIKPAWNGNDGQGHFILNYGGGGGILIGKDGGNNLRIILNRFGIHPGGEIGSAVNISSWLANQWHHVAFTWSNTTRKLQIYIDGARKVEDSFTITLPSISSSTFQIGGDGSGSYINAVIDDLRISDVARSPQEISSRMLNGLTVTSWTLNPATSTIEMYPGWYYWIPMSISASTNIGNIVLPVLAASWASSDPSVAVMDPSGRIKALAPGMTTLTGTLGGQQQNIGINVSAPALPPVVESIDSYLATPAAGYLYRVPVVIIRYFPTTDGVNLDSSATGYTSTLASLKSNVEQIERRHKFMLEEGSRFRGYKTPGASPALGYQVIKVITVYEDVPPGFEAPGGGYFPDYNQILNRFDAENLVNNLGVKEFWLVHYHFGRIVPNESNMSSPTTGDISNSYRTNGDQPVFNRTYVTYGINLALSQNEATHNHGHHLESILTNVNWLQDFNTDLFWNKFGRPVKAGFNPPARCGNTHFPPNGTSDYDYNNPTPAASDIMDWTPEGGPTTMVNAQTWGNIPYPWPEGQNPPNHVESHWYIFWMQSMPGIDNAIQYLSNKMTNWWQFTADWDAAIQRGIGLYEPGNCASQLSSTGLTMPDSGGPGSVSVTAPAGCKWIATSNFPEWISATNGGNGNGQVDFTVAPNSGPPRTGTIVIAGQRFTITQTGIEYEADVSPRPNGSGTVVVSDWVQVGRFSVGLDTPGSMSEFKRADCAPRSSLGDGQITVADWVQAGRYSVGLDPVTTVGGPTGGGALPAGMMSLERSNKDVTRELSLSSQYPDRSHLIVPVELKARGGENAVSFSLQFDPAVLRYSGYSSGSDTTGNVLVKTDLAGRGVLSFAVALNPGKEYRAGMREIVLVKFRTIRPGDRSGGVRIADGPIPLSLADSKGNILPVKAINGIISETLNDPHVRAKQ